MVKILFFASFREEAGTTEFELEVRGSTTVSDLYQQLRLHFPNLKAESDFTLVSVNQDFATWGSRVGPGDEIAFFPPVSGGSA